jgi:hypothetical protein
VDNPDFLVRRKDAEECRIHQILSFDPNRLSMMDYNQRRVQHSRKDLYLCSLPTRHIVVECQEFLHAANQYVVCRLTQVE